MLSYREAERIAQEYIDYPTPGTDVLLRQHTISKPYGWVFFYQTRLYAETRDPDQALVGNLPFLVDRSDGSIHCKPPLVPMERFLAEYEASLPPERLRAPLEEPEQP